MRIRFLKDYFTFRQDQMIEIDQNKFTIFYGNQGAGKSTLIKAIGDSTVSKKVANKYIQFEDLRQQEVLYAKAESFRANDKAFITNRKDMMKVKLNHKSHGEAWLMFLETLKKPDSRGSMVLIDEPETALSVDSQLYFCDLMLNLKYRYGISALIATHSPFIIEFLADDVIEIPTGNRLDKQELLTSINNKIQHFRDTRINK